MIAILSLNHDAAIFTYDVAFGDGNRGEKTLPDRQLRLFDLDFQQIAVLCDVEIGGWSQHLTNQLLYNLNLTDDRMEALRSELEANIREFSVVNDEQLPQEVPADEETKKLSTLLLMPEKKLKKYAVDPKEASLDDALEKVSKIVSVVLCRLICYTKTTRTRPSTAVK